MSAGRLSESRSKRIARVVREALLRDGFPRDEAAGVAAAAVFGYETMLEAGVTPESVGRSAIREESRRRSPRRRVFHV